MKKELLFVLIHFLCLYSSAQEVISSQGDFYQTNIGSVSFTIGEVVINTESDGNNDITQGFQQSNWEFLGNNYPAFDILASAYPNPFDQQITIQMDSPLYGLFKLYDATGRLIQSGKLQGITTEINTDKLESGSYHLSLEDEASGKRVVLPIIKHK